MSWNFSRALCWILVSFFVTPATAQSKRPSSSDVHYDVTMVTKLAVPKKRNIEQVRVWHALPTPRDWFGPVKTVSFEPRNLGERQYNKQFDSHHVFFRRTTGLVAGQEIRFESRFKVVSRDREFDPKKSKTQWKDITGEKNKSTDRRIIRYAKLLRNESSPAKAVLLATQIVNKHMSYDANVPYLSNDLEKMLTQRKGHCGHYFHFFKTLCESVGINIRVARGLNLYCPDGVSSALHKIRPDYTNIHTWAEVNLPKDGWIEIEPTESRSPFQIQAHLIQNNPWFQNYAVWIREDGKESLHRWKHVNGRYRSDFELSHTITYQKRSARKRR